MTNKDNGKRVEKLRTNSKDHFEEEMTGLVIWNGNMNLGVSSI